MSERKETLLMVKGIIRMCQENFKEGIYTQLNDICGCFLDIEEELEGIIEKRICGGESLHTSKMRRLDRINYKLSLYFGTEILNGNPVENRVGDKVPEYKLREEDLLIFIRVAVKYAQERIDKYNSKNIFGETA